MNRFNPIIKILNYCKIKKIPGIFKCIPIFIFLWLIFLSFNANATIDSDPGVLDNVLARYQTVAGTWGTVILARASWLFWVLATISMVWTFGMMALRKADIGEFFSEFIRFTVTTGFFWWLLSNGPAFAKSIMTGMSQMAANASGNPTTFSPSNIVDIGFGIFFKVIDQSKVLHPIDSLCGILMSGCILVVLALIGVNMLILLVSGWVLAYAGIFFLGFGGAKWTSDLAIGYFKNVLGLAAQLMTMVLLVGIGKSFVDQYYTAMSANISYKELGVMLVVAIVLLDLVTKVPPMVGAISGANIQALGSGFGAGSALGAAAVGGAAIATAGAALAVGATSMTGGAKALMAAFSSATASGNGGGGSSIGDLMNTAQGGDGDSCGSNLLTSAMGDPGGGSSWSGSDCGNSTSERSSGGESSDSKDGSSESGGTTSNNSTGGETASRQGSSSDAKGADDSGTSGDGKPGGAHTAGGLAAKVGRIAAGTAGNLAAGSWDVAKSKGRSIKDNFMGRVNETTGGKIAAAINARSEVKFDGNSLSAGKANDEKAVDAESEVAAFRDRQ